MVTVAATRAEVDALLSACAGTMRPTRGRRIRGVITVSLFVVLAALMLRSSVAMAAVYVVAAVALIPEFFSLREVSPAGVRVRSPLGLDSRFVPAENIGRIHALVRGWNVTLVVGDGWWPLQVPLVGPQRDALISAHRDLFPEVDRARDSDRRNRYIFSRAAAVRSALVALVAFGIFAILRGLPQWHAIQLVAGAIALAGVLGAFASVFTAVAALPPRRA